jgi:hypothetical protein
MVESRSLLAVAAWMISSFASGILSSAGDALP